MTVSCGRSERLEERHQRVLVGFGKLGAVSGAFVACIGVARHGGVVAEELDALARGHVGYEADVDRVVDVVAAPERLGPRGSRFQQRSEEHTSELQSLMRISYAVFCLK